MGKKISYRFQSNYPAPSGERLPTSSAAVCITELVQEEFCQIVNVRMQYHKNYHK